MIREREQEEEEEEIFDIIPFFARALSTSTQKSSFALALSTSDLGPLLRFLAVLTKQLQMIHFRSLSWITIPGVLPAPLASYSAVMGSPSSCE